MARFAASFAATLNIRKRLEYLLVGNPSRQAFFAKNGIGDHPWKLLLAEDVAGINEIIVESYIARSDHVVKSAPKNLSHFHDRILKVYSVDLSRDRTEIAGLVMRLAITVEYVALRKLDGSWINVLKHLLQSR